MPPRCLPRRRRRCQPLCATPRRRHPGPRRWPWPRHRRHRPGQRGRPPRRGPPGWAGRQHRAQPSPRSAPLQRDQRHPGRRGRLRCDHQRRRPGRRGRPRHPGSRGWPWRDRRHRPHRPHAWPPRPGPRRQVGRPGRNGWAGRRPYRPRGWPRRRPGPGRASPPWCSCRAGSARDPGQHRHPDQSHPVSPGPSTVSLRRPGLLFLGAWPARGGSRHSKPVRSGAGSCPAAGDFPVS